ncbi:MAG: hypothetical protein K2X82_28205 [Gemmataceae bacterium]|nr:hypothetical protein [Gemmataceae bacterium]
MHHAVRTSLRLEALDGRVLPSSGLSDPGTDSAAQNSALIAPTGAIAVNATSWYSKAVIYIKTADGKEYSEAYSIAGNETFPALAQRVGAALAADGWTVAVNDTTITISGRTVNGRFQAITGIGFAYYGTPNRIMPARWWPGLAGTTANLPTYSPTISQDGSTIQGWVQNP